MINIGPCLLHFDDGQKVGRDSYENYAKMHEGK